MTHNHTIKMIRDALKLDEATLLEIFRLSDPQVGEADVRDLLKDEDEPDFVLCSDAGMALFMDGLIRFKRGDDGKPRPEAQAAQMSNNAIWKKLRIALELKEEAVLELMKKAEMAMTPAELTAYFRKEGHRNFKRCSDRILTAFIKAVAL
jgi:uncharacterized protein YehS (DUF1456 family)